MNSNNFVNKGGYFPLTIYKLIITKRNNVVHCFSHPNSNILLIYSYVLTQLALLHSLPSSSFKLSCYALSRWMVGGTIWSIGGGSAGHVMVLISERQRLSCGAFDKPSSVLTSTPPSN